MDSIVDNTNEEPEGIDDSPDLEMNDYPLDNLLIRDAPRSVFEVCRRIEQEQYIMDPDFQRDFVWGLEKQSRLIESLLIGKEVSGFTGKTAKSSGRHAASRLGRATGTAQGTVLRRRIAAHKLPAIL